VFASGFSNGAGFVNVLACNVTLSNRFAAFGPHSVAIYPNQPFTVCAAGGTTTPATIDTSNIVEFNRIPCKAGRPSQPYMEFHGTGDTQIYYNGDLNHNSYCLPTIPHVVMDWCVLWILPLEKTNH